MKKYFNSVEDASTGRPVANAEIAVYDNGTSNLATIYSDDGITITNNPVKSDATGYFEFWADGVYTLEVSYNGALKRSISGVEIIEAYPYPGLSDGEVTEPKLAPDSVTAEKIVSGQLIAIHLTDDPDELAAITDKLVYDPEFDDSQKTTVPAKLRQYVSINDWGHVDGGTADATEAIQYALENAGDIDGRGMTYKVTDTLLVSHDRTRLHNLTLIGEKTDGRMIEVTGNDFVLEDFDLDGGFPEDAGSQGDAMIDGILISGALRPTVRNGAIRNFYGKTGSDFTAALGFVNCTDQQAHNIQFENIGWDNPQAYCFSIRGAFDTPATGGQFSGLTMRKVNNGTHLSSCRKIKGRGVLIDGAADNGVYYTGVIEEVDLDDYFIKGAAEAVVLRSFYDNDPPNQDFVEQLATKARLTNFTIIGATTRALALRQGGGYFCANWNMFGCQTGVTTSTTFTDGLKHSQFYNFALIGTIGAPISLGGTVNCDGLDFFNTYIRGVNTTNAVGIGANPNNIRFWNAVILAGGGSGSVGIAFPASASGARRGIVSNLYTDLATPVSYNAEDAIAVTRISPTEGFVVGGASGANGWRHPAWFGASALWVDSTGVLRIKSSAPASDTDGTVVGSQS